MNPILYPVPNEDNQNVSYPDPKDLASEEKVIGSMILSPIAVSDVIDIVNANDFYDPGHQELFNTIYAQYANNKPIEILAIHQALPQNLQGRFSAAHLFALTNNIVSAHSASYYAQKIKQVALLRRLSETFIRSISGVQRNSDPFDIATETINQLTNTLTEQEKVSLTAYDAVTRAAEYSAGKADGTIKDFGLSTGYADLDSLLNGLRDGQLILCAGRPGTGKSIFALDVARNISMKELKPVLFFSLEMSELEIGQRLLSAESGIPLASIISGQMSDQQWEQLEQARNKVQNAPLYIDTRSRLTTAEIRAKAHQMKLSQNLQLIIVDYLGLITHPRENKMDSRQAIVSDISRELKLIAKDIAPVLALAQLNRALESRQEKKPLLSDLRDSGALEQDSDVVLLLHRDDLYNKESTKAGEVNVSVAKHRNGPTGEIYLANQYHLARMQNLF